VRNDDKTNDKPHPFQGWEEVRCGVGEPQAF